MTTDNMHLRRKTVLVADRDPAVLLLVRTILVAEGYRVLLAAAAESAIRCAKTKNLRIDLALIDRDLDGPGGELEQALAALRPGLRVMPMSGFADGPVIRIHMPELPKLVVEDSPVTYLSAGGAC